MRDKYVPGAAEVIGMCYQFHSVDIGCGISVSELQPIDERLRSKICFTSNSRGSPVVVLIVETNRLCFCLIAVLCILECVVDAENGVSILNEIWCWKKVDNSMTERAESKVVQQDSQIQKHTDSMINSYLQREKLRTGSAAQTTL